MMETDVEDEMEDQREVCDDDIDNEEEERDREREGGDERFSS